MGHRKGNLQCMQDPAGFTVTRPYYFIPVHRSANTQLIVQIVKVSV